MMLLGVGIARRRGVHYHGDVASSSSSAAAEHARHHHHHHHYSHSYHALHAAPAPAASTTGVAGPALAARVRLEEKLRGAALPSRWSCRLMRDGRSTTPRHPQSTRRDEQDSLPLPPTDAELWRPAAQLPAAASASASPDLSSASASTQRAELTRTLSEVDVCAVCLDEVMPEERRQRAVTRLPCSHKYHSECVLPWLAIHPDCPCCRALVPVADTLVQVGDIAS